MAEAVAIVGLVASIASLVDISAKVVSRIHDFTTESSDVPESFRSLSTRLPLLTATLQHIKSQAEECRFPEDVTKALKAVVDDTSTQVFDIQILLSKVLPSDGASKLERALKALKSLAKEDKVERALERLYGNNEILVLYQTTQHVDTGDRILEALSKLSITPQTSRLSPLSNIPFARDPDFVDRGTLFDQLYENCTLPASRTALVGLGGVGKSQLAIELGYRIREKSPETWVLWVHAGSAARLEQSFQEIAEDIDIPGRQDPKANLFQLVHSWLRDRRNGPWLLILDNVDNPNLLSEFGEAVQRGQGPGAHSKGPQPLTAYLPQTPNGSILVTSRSQAVALKLVEEKNVLAVQPMAPAHALDLFKKKLGPLDRGDDAPELAAALEYMPLAIAQAAAYISQRAPRYSVQRYLEDYRKNDRKKTSLLNHEGGQLRRDWEAKNSIIITWQISFEYIHQTWPSAADLLSLMSFFDRQGIPETLVRKRFESGNGDESSKEQNQPASREEEHNEDSAQEGSEDDSFEDDVQVLRNYSFISVDSNGSFEMHALVQLATRKWLEANAKLEQWKDLYIKNLCTEFPARDYENWAYSQILFPHVKSAVTQRPKGEDSLLDWALLLDRAARYAENRGTTEEVLCLANIVVEVRKKILGAEHVETLYAMSILGLGYQRGGRWSEAEAIETQVMEISQRVLGELHDQTLRSILNLASTYRDLGRWEESEKMILQVIETEKTTLGQEHRSTLISMSNLAMTYWQRGRLKEAEDLNNEVLEARIKVLGHEHPDTINSRGKLACVYIDQGRLAEAEELTLEVVESRKTILGHEHPTTLVSIANLARVYTKQGRWKESEEIEIQVLEIFERTLGEEHPETLISMHNLACLWKDQGREKEAIELMKRAIRLGGRVGGFDNPRTKMSLQVLREWGVGDGEVGGEG